VSHRKQECHTPEERNVQNSVHAGNPSSSSRGERVRLDRTSLRIGSIVTISRSILNSCKHKEEQDGNAHASSTEHAHERDMLQCSRYAHDHAHDSHDDREDYSTHTVVGESVEDLGSSQDMEAYQHYVIQ